ncbi:hypothetical protein Fmac_018814 [Flemingia macrophylla]|uniref:Uncharacterized protein n=1 Tax=Flemingia macrophylla TaxID=520843 RepID=A0ABD1M6Q2_9FABA
MMVLQNPVCINLRNLNIEIRFLVGSHEFQQINICRSQHYFALNYFKTLFNI